MTREAASGTGLKMTPSILGWPFQYAVVALDHDPVAGLPLHEDVGSGPHRVEAVLVAVLLQRGRADHAPRPVGEVGQQRAEGLLHLDFQRVVVQGPGVGDEGLVEAGAQGALGGVGVPFDVEHHGLSVERRAVVEADALAQLEGPGEPVGRRLPRGGQLGDDVPLFREFHQVVVDVADHDFRGVVRLVGRVQADGLRTQGENQILALRGQAAAGRRQGQAHGQQADQCMSTHGQILRLDNDSDCPDGHPRDARPLARDGAASSCLKVGRMIPRPCRRCNRDYRDRNRSHFRDGGSTPCRS